MSYQGIGSPQWRWNLKSQALNRVQATFKNVLNLPENRANELSKSPNAGTDEEGENHQNVTNQKLIWQSLQNILKTCIKKVSQVISHPSQCARRYSA